MIEQEKAFRLLLFARAMCPEGDKLPVRSCAVKKNILRNCGAEQPFVPENVLFLCLLLYVCLPLISLISGKQSALPPYGIRCSPDLSVIIRGIVLIAS
jgi:hypothetical protein